MEQTKPLRCRSTLSSMTPSPFVPFYFFFSLWPSNTKLHFLSSSSSPLFHFHFSTCWRWQAFNTLFLTWHKCGRRSSTSNRETHKVKCPQKLCRFLIYLFISGNLDFQSTGNSCVTQNIHQQFHKVTSFGFSHTSKLNREQLAWGWGWGGGHLSCRTITLSLWKAPSRNSVTWVVCYIAAFKENIVWFIFRPSLSSSISSPAFRQAEMKRRVAF